MHTPDGRRGTRRKEEPDKIKAHGETVSEKKDKDRIDNGHPIKKEVI
jgi:hypothetical protein